MTTNDIEEPSGERERVLQRLEKRRDFQGHVVAYLVINAAVWALWAGTGHGYPWPAWLSGLWAIGLVMNAWDVYFLRPITETDIERELRRLRSAG